MCKSYSFVSSTLFSIYSVLGTGTAGRCCCEQGRWDRSILLIIWLQTLISVLILFCQLVVSIHLRSSWIKIPNSNNELLLSNLAIYRIFMNAGQEMFLSLQIFHFNAWLCALWSLSGRGFLGLTSHGPEGRTFKVKWKLKQYSEVLYFLTITFLITLSFFYLAVECMVKIWIFWCIPLTPI